MRPLENFPRGIGLASSVALSNSSRCSVNNPAWVSVSDKLREVVRAGYLLEFVVV